MPYHSYKLRPGFDETDGSGALTTEQLVEQRMKRIQSMIPTKLACGKSNPNVHCCKDRRCKCLASGVHCEADCEYSKIRFHNSRAVQNVVTELHLQKSSQIHSFLQNALYSHISDADSYEPINHKFYSLNKD